MDRISKPEGEPVKPIDFELFDLMVNGDITKRTQEDYDRVLAFLPEDVRTKELEADEREAKPFNGKIESLKEIVSFMSRLEHADHTIAVQLKPEIEDHIHSVNQLISTLRSEIASRQNELLKGDQPSSLKIIEKRMPEDPVLFSRLKVEHMNSFRGRLLCDSRLSCATTTLSLLLSYKSAVEQMLNHLTDHEERYHFCTAQCPQEIGGPFCLKSATSLLQNLTENIQRTRWNHLHSVFCDLKFSRFEQRLDNDLERFRQDSKEFDRKLNEMVVETRQFYSDCHEVMMMAQENNDGVVEIAELMFDLPPSGRSLQQFLSDTTRSVQAQRAQLNQASSL